MSKKNNYPFSSSSRRILCRFCDYIFICLVGILFCYLLISISLGFELNNKYYDRNLFSSMFMLSIVINFIIWLIYFIFIPSKFNGRTLFSLIFKIRLYWEENNKIILRLLKHEGLFILPIYFINFIMSLLTFAFTDQFAFIINIFSFTIIRSSMASDIVGSIIFVLFIISSLPIVGVIINTILNNGTPSYLDDVTKIYVVYMKKIINNKSELNNKKTTKLPCSIDERELEKL